MILDAHKISALSRRFEQAGGKRISITEETARAVANALDFYAASLLMRIEEGRFCVHTLTRAGDLMEILARSSNSHVAAAAFEEAIKHRPRDVVTLQHGFRVIRRFEGGPYPAAPALALAIDTKKAPPAKPDRAANEA